MGRVEASGRLPFEISLKLHFLALCTVQLVQGNVARGTLEGNGDFLQIYNSDQLIFTESIIALKTSWFF